MLLQAEHAEVELAGLDAPFWRLENTTLGRARMRRHLHSQSMASRYWHRGA
jgi:hypothetical protein